MTPDHDFSFVRSVWRVEETESTNDLAKRLVASAQVNLPMLVWADRQTRGRGQGSNAWWSDSGSLTATIVLDPSDFGLTLAQESMVALTVACTVILAIRAHYPECRPGIRWPNDIEVGGRKLGGILPERVESPDGPRLLIGIGLNVRTRLEDAPPEIRKMAASLAEWPVRPAPGDAVGLMLGQILDRLQDQLSLLARGSDELVRAWKRYDALFGSKVRIEIGGEIVEAIANGIHDSGGLWVVQEGQLQLIHAGRILRD